MSFQPQQHAVDMRKPGLSIVLALGLVGFLGGCNKEDSGAPVCGRNKVLYRLSELSLNRPGIDDANVDGDMEHNRENAFSWMMTAAQDAIQTFAVQERFNRSATEGETGLLFTLNVDNFDDSCAELQIATAAPADSLMSPTGTISQPAQLNVGQPIATLRGRIKDNMLLFPLPGEPGYEASAAQELTINVHLGATVMTLPIQEIHFSGRADADGITDGQIHGVLEYGAFRTQMAHVVAAESTQYVHDNPLSQGASRVIGLLEQIDNPDSVSAKKCQVVEACCHKSPTTCFIMDEEVVALGPFEKVVQPDVKMFDHGHIAPNPDAPPETFDAISLGLAFRARQGDFALPCSPASGWCRVPDLPPILQQQFQGVWAAARNDVWVVGQESIILHYDGHRWGQYELLSRIMLRGIFGFASTGDVFVTGDDGTILHFNGRSFDEMPCPTRESLRAIWGSSPKDLWAVGENATLLHYDGTNWTLWPVPGTAMGQRLDAIYGTSASDVWLSGQSGVLLHFDGVKWTAATNTKFEKIRGLWATATPDYQLWAVTSSRVVERFDGTSWLTFLKSSSGAKAPFDVDLQGVHAERPDNVWVVGNSATILHFNGAQSYTQLNHFPLPEDVTASHADLYGVFAIGGTDAWAVGAEGIILHCTQRNRAGGCVSE